MTRTLRDHYLCNPIIVGRRGLPAFSRLLPQVFARRPFAFNRGTTQRSKVKCAHAASIEDAISQCIRCALYRGKAWSHLTGEVLVSAWLSEKGATRVVSAASDGSETVDQVKRMFSRISCRTTFVVTALARDLVQHPQHDSPRKSWLV